MKDVRMRALTGLTLCIIGYSLALCTPLAAAVKQEHPRIWLSPGKLAELNARADRGAASWQRLISWCDGHLNDDPGSYLSDAAYGLSMVKTVNFSLAYQVTDDPRYAEKAAQIVIYAIQNPPMGGLVEWFSGYRWYPARYALPGMAITLDWCWDALTTAQRDIIASGLNTICDGMLAESGIWAWNDPSNNYYYGDMWGLTAAAYALYYHPDHASDAERYLDYAKGTMLDQAIKFANGSPLIWDLWGSSTGRANGGMWNEGTGYGGVNYECIFSSVLAVRSAEEPDSYPEFDFPDETILFHIYATYPNGDYILSEGDGAGTMTITDKIRVPVVLATALASETVKGYGQYWLNNFSSPTGSDYKFYHEFMWYDDQLAEVDYSGTLPDFHHAEGSQILVWREGWNEDDCWISMRIGLLNTDHAHNGLGNFVIYDDGPLAPDKATVTGQNELHSDSHHSVLFIEPGQDSKLFWGASEIEHLASTSKYLYYAGDMSDPYLAQPSYRNNTVAHKEREFFLLKEEKTLLVMDRGSSLSASTEKVFQVYLDGTASASGDDYRSTNGNNDLIINTAWPPDAVTNSATSSLPLLQVRYPRQIEVNTFLHILKVSPSGGNLNASPVNSTDQSVVAAAFQSMADDADYLVAFSNDPEGDVINAAQFSMTWSRYSSGARIYVMNVQPNTTYYVSSGADGVTATVTVSSSPLGSGSSAESNEHGILFAPVSDFGEVGGPSPTPDGTEIDKGSNLD